MPIATAGVPVKVIITELTELGSIDPGDNLGDYYAIVNIDGGDDQSNIDNRCNFGVSFPGGLFYPANIFRDFDAQAECPENSTPWVFTSELPSITGPVTVEIRVKDKDGGITGDDDAADLSDESPDDNVLDLEIDPETGRWSGDIDWPDTCSRALNELGKIMCVSAYRRVWTAMVTACWTSGNVPVWMSIMME